MSMRSMKSTNANESVQTENSLWELVPLVSVFGSLTISGNGGFRRSYDCWVCKFSSRAFVM